MDNDIYQEHILDHYKHPRRKYSQSKPTYTKTENNPLCGDEIKIDLTIKSNKIHDISFDGHGCAISQAAASILTEFLQQKEMSKIKKITEQDMINMLHIPISHTRTKCALLALKTAKSINLSNSTIIHSINKNIKKNMVKTKPHSKKEKVNRT